MLRGLDFVLPATQVAGERVACPPAREVRQDRVERDALQIDRAIHRIERVVDENIASDHSDFGDVVAEPGDFTPLQIDICAEVAADVHRGEAGFCLGPRGPECSTPVAGS